MPLWAFTLLNFLIQVAQVFMDTSIESIVIQQARADPDGGQRDLQALRLMFFGLGAFIGGFVSGSIEQNDSARGVFIYVSVQIFLIFAQTWFLPDELETNKYAMGEQLTEGLKKPMIQVDSTAQSVVVQ